MRILNREIGGRAAPFVIAEMSGNHNHSLDRALAIVDAAAATGAHALKIQTYTPETMTLDLAEGDFFIADRNSSWSGRTLFDLYREAYTPWEWHPPIFERATQLGMIPFSTPFDETAVEFLEKLGVACYKIASFENTDLPLIRKVSGFGAYIEGWALYSEQLAQEMGFYADDPAGELGYIHDALLRSGRLVVDTGIHSLRWSREKAVETLSGIEGDPPAYAGQEIDRYAVNPGQACSYMVGKVTILRLREKAKAALGPRFDIRQFHDAVLLAGSMPLIVLEQVVDSYIASHKAA